MYRYPNKRVVRRGAGGRFQKVTFEDAGIGGTCPVCRHFLLRYYDGDASTHTPDPRRFRYRCYTCEPEATSPQARQGQGKE